MGNSRRMLLIKTIWGKHPIFMLIVFINTDFNYKMFVDFGGHLPYTERSGQTNKLPNFFVY